MASKKNFYRLLGEVLNESDILSIARTTVSRDRRELEGKPTPERQAATVFDYANACSA